MRTASDETAVADQSSSVEIVTQALSQAAEDIERARDAVRALLDLVPRAEPRSPSAPMSLVGCDGRSLPPLGLLGEGGMARVFLAEDTTVGRHVAIEGAPA
ncbi:MAG: hypothetical protein HS111_12270 [Kofleriaceae bacterium]|nr:hypothetical protein [Kofleriaceae bacterium]